MSEKIEQYLFIYSYSRYNLISQLHFAKLLTVGLYMQVDHKNKMSDIHVPSLQNVFKDNNNISCRTNQIKLTTAIITLYIYIFFFHWISQAFIKKA